MKTITTQPTYIACTVSLILALSACGGGSGGSDGGGQTPSPGSGTPTNKAPTHSGNISQSFFESDSAQVIDLLSGASDADGDTLTVINAVANTSNPNMGYSLSGHQLTITPNDFIEEIAADESVTISYQYDISDGKAEVARSVSITVNGESPAGPPPVPAPVSSLITVNLLTQQYLGDVSKLDRSKFFNMHDNHNSSRYSLDLIDQYVNDYRVGHGRIFWSPLSVGKNHLVDNGTYPSTQYAMTHGANNLASAKNNPRVAITSNRMVVTDHPANPMAGGGSNDPIDGARWAADYFQYYYDDEIRPLFYEPMNEPFIHAGEYPEHGNREQVIALMTEWHKEIGKAFDARPALADVSVIGFASAWPSFEFNDFSHFESRFKYFVDNAGEHVDAFSVHLYDGTNVVGANSKRSGSNAQAILDLIETYSMYKLDEVKPHAITEYGNIVDREQGVIHYDEAVNSQTIKSFNHIMHELMNREDRLLTSIPFLTGYSWWHWQNPSLGNGHPYNPSLWRPNRDNLELVDVGDGTMRWEFKDANATDNYLLNNNALFLDFWKDVDGKRVHISNTDPDAQVSAFLNDDTAFIIVSNLDENDRDIALDLAAMAGYQYNSVRIERLTVPADAGAALSIETISDGAEITGADLDFTRLTLAPAESVKFTFYLNKAVEFSQTQKRESFYSDTHLTRITANQAINFTFNNVKVDSKPDGNAYANLRMSIGRAHTASKKPTVTINGTQITVPDNWPGYDQANRDEFFGAITMPVDHALLTDTTQVSITFPDSGGRIASVVLDVNNTVDPVLATSVSLGDNIVKSPNQTAQLIATVLPANASNTSVTWASSNTAVATVDENGLVTTLSAGTTTITATTANNLSDSIEVTVEAANSNLLANANGDFEQALDSNVIMARQGGGQDNLATFEIRQEAAEDGAGGLYIDNSAGSLKLQFTPSAVIQGAQAGKTYRLSVDVKVVSGSHVLWTEIQNGSGGWKNASIANTSDWQTVSTQYSGEELGSGFGVNFHIDPQSNGSGGVIYADNVRLEAID